MRDIGRASPAPVPGADCYRRRVTKLWALLPSLLLACTSTTPDKPGGAGKSASTVVDLSTFSTSCKVDADCTTVKVNKCQCGCNNNAIAVTEQAKFHAALAAIECPHMDPDKMPLCSECIPFVARCAEGTCKAERPPDPRPYSPPNVQPDAQP